MSDGGKEIGKDYEQQSTRKPAGNEDFVRTIAKIAVAQVCEDEGFQSFQHSALEAFADVATRYVRELGKTSNHYANQAGRSECNVYDVIRGLEDLGSIQGFPGASDINHSLAKSGTIREIRQYVGLVEGIPFVFSLPRFPVSKERSSPSSFLQMGKDPPEHIPPWLPAFPFSEPRGSSPALGERETDGHTASKESEKEVEARKKEEAELMNVRQRQQQQQLQEQQQQQQLLQEQQKQQVQEQQQQQQQQQQLAANNGSEQISEAVEMNPYLAPPFAYGEKAVSSVEFPSRHWDEIHHVNVMDTYAPVAETARNEVSETKEPNKQVGLDERPTVQLKFSSARKSLRTSKNVVAQTKGVEKLAILFERDDENDEKKRRAEQILKDSMETPLDTTEL